MLSSPAPWRFFRASSRSLPQQSFSGGVYESQHFVRIEGEYRNVNFFDHTLQQRGRLDRSSAMFASRSARALISRDSSPRASSGIAIRARKE